jgi:hypothetical protein
MLEPVESLEKIPHRMTQWDRAELYEIIEKTLRDKKLLLKGAE